MMKNPRTKVKSYRRSANVHFHDIGLAGMNEMKTLGWKMLTLAGTMKYLGHENVRGLMRSLYKFRYEK